MGKRGILVVDIQADFTEAYTGSLAASGTDMVYVNNILAATEKYAREGLPIYASQDWHPQNHCSFAVNNPGSKPFQIIEIDGRKQTMWPVHCVQNHSGARLLLPDGILKKVVRKGMNKHYDSYSAFRDDGGNETVLQQTFDEDHIEEIVLYGLATDYCVLYTARDAVEAGLVVQVRLGLCRGVSSITTESAVAELEKMGAELI